MANNNTFGNTLQFTSWGESHGKAVGCVVDGVPANLPLKEENIQYELNRRRPGQSAVTTPRQENDRVEILSGVFEGHTIGTPISLVIWNENQNSKDYSNLKDVYRPGHADYSYDMRYGNRDYRGGGRSSGRETINRVAAGAIAKLMLQRLGVKTIAHVKEIGSVRAENVHYEEIEKNMIRTADPDAVAPMTAAIMDAKAKEDSLGGVIECVVLNLPPGIGSPIYNKLDARLANAIMSIGAIKAVSFGSGFQGTKLFGSEHNDEVIGLDEKGLHFKNNHSGGILGGISHGDPLLLTLAVKAASSIAKQQKTFDKHSAPISLSVKGRHDPCICPRVVPVVEAMVNFVLADCLLEQHYFPSSF